MVGLTEEQIQVASKAYRKESQGIWDSDKPRQEKAELSMGLQSVYDRIARAQLKKVVEWGDEPCKEHPGEYGISKRHYCGICWQSLLEEVK